MKLTSSTSLKSSEITSSNTKNTYNDSTNISNPNTPVPSPSTANSTNYTSTNAQISSTNLQKVSSKSITSASTSVASLKLPANESAFKSAGQNQQTATGPPGLTTPKQNSRNNNLNGSNQQVAKANKNISQNESSLIGFVFNYL